MVDRAVDAVGHWAVDRGGSKKQPNIVLENLIRVTRPCGGLAIPGLSVPTDPGAPDKLSEDDQILVPFGKLFGKVCVYVILLGAVNPFSTFSCGCRADNISCLE
jgi:hypothetical protein